MKDLWPDTFVEEVNLASKISFLRKVLGDAGPASSYIQTVAKIGYRFLPAVTRIWSSGPAAAASPTATGERAIRFIALPFAIVNGDERIAFLGQSLPEAISASLAGLRSLTVRSSLLAARLAEQPKDLRWIAREADVDVLLAGTILCEGGRLRVTAELVEVPSGTLAGSFVCQAGRDAVFEVQDSLARRIVERLLPWLSDLDRRSLTHDVPVSARAYEFYLRGTHAERERNLENISTARDLYRECLKEDPDYAPAWARLGRCYWFLEKLYPEGPRNLEATRWAFCRAFALNPDLPIAHNNYTPVETDFGRAEQALVRLLGQAEKHPNDPELFSGLVQATRYCGLLDESLRAHQRARQLDSRAVTSVTHTYFLLGDYERTIESYPPGYRYYLDAAALAAAGREKEALAILNRRSHRMPMVDSLRFLLQGDDSKSFDIIRRALEGEPPPEPEIRFYLARHLARQGAGAEALQTIHRLAGGGFFCSTALHRDPWLRPLAALREFQGTLAAVLEREAAARAAFEAAGGQKILPLSLAGAGG